MDSDHESNSPGESHCIEEECLNESDSLINENLSNIFGELRESFQQHQGSDPILSRNNLNSSIQPLKSDSGVFHNFYPLSFLQTEEHLNTLENFPNYSYQTFENESSKKIIPFQEIHYFDDKDMSLQQNDFSRTQSNENQNILPFSQSLCATQPSETDVSHPLTVEASGIVQSINPQLFTEVREFSDDAYETLQAAPMKINLRELNVNHFRSSPQKCPESEKNRIQILDSVNPQQSGNEHSTSHSSFIPSHQVYQSKLNVRQVISSKFHNVFEGEFRKRQAGKIRTCPQYNRGNQDSFLQRFRQSREGDLPHPKQQCEGRENFNQSSRRRGRKKSKTKAKEVVRQPLIDSIIDEMYPMRGVKKEFEVNQPIQQPNEYGVRETDELPPVTRALAAKRSTERPLSFLTQAVNKIYYKNKSFTCQYPSSLLDRFLETCLDMHQKKTSDRVEDLIIFAKSNDFSLFQNPNSNSEETINIFVFGHGNCSRLLLTAYSREFSLNFVSPFSLVLQRNFSRCFVVSVNVWQIDDLQGSMKFMELCSAASKSAFMFVFNLTELPSLQFINNVIGRLNRMRVPIIFVGCKDSGIQESQLAVYRNPKSIKARHVLQAKYDISAFLLCRVDSIDEVDSVFLTAIDISRFINQF